MLQTSCNSNLTLHRGMFCYTANTSTKYRYVNGNEIPFQKRLTCSMNALINLAPNRLRNKEKKKFCFVMVIYYRVHLLMLGLLNSFGVRWSALFVAGVEIERTY